MLLLGSFYHRSSVWTNCRTARTTWATWTRLSRPTWSSWTKRTCWYDTISWIFQQFLHDVLLMHFYSSRKKLILFSDSFQKVLIDPESDRVDSDQDLSTGSPMVRKRTLLWSKNLDFQEKKVKVFHFYSLLWLWSFIGLSFRVYYFQSILWHFSHQRRTCCVKITSQSLGQNCAQIGENF